MDSFSTLPGSPRFNAFSCGFGGRFGEGCSEDDVARRAPDRSWQAALEEQARRAGREAEAGGSRPEGERLDLKNEGAESGPGDPADRPRARRERHVAAPQVV